MKRDELKNSVLRLLASPSYMPMPKRGLARQLHIDDEDYVAFKELLAEMADEGTIDELKKGKWGLPLGGNVPPEKKKNHRSSNDDDSSDTLDSDESAKLDLAAGEVHRNAGSETRKHAGTLDGPFNTSREAATVNDLVVGDDGAVGGASPAFWEGSGFTLLEAEERSDLIDGRRLGRGERSERDCNGDQTRDHRLYDIGSI